jgi:predicted NBD/HSP70 family sugar kinase
MNAGLAALDIGASKIDALSFRSSEVMSARVELHEEASLADDLSTLRRCLALLRLPSGGTVVAAFPGLMRNGRVLRWPNRPSWAGLELVGILREHLGATHVVIEDDASTGALASRYLFPEASSWMYVNVGSGVGSGIVLDGELWRGETGGSGELGHMNAERGSRIACSCGRLGCLQLFASGRGMWDRLLERDPGYRRHGSLRGLLESEARHDTAVQTVLVRGAELLAWAVDLASDLLDLRRLHFGGSVLSSVCFREALERALPVREAGLRTLAREVRIAPRLNASLVGAAWHAAAQTDLQGREREHVDRWLREQIERSRADAA